MFYTEGVVSYAFGIPMKQIIYDYKRLREAIVLLLDYRFGARREQNVREAIKDLRHARKFTRTIEPLNELIKVAKQSPTKALDILEPIARKREELEQQRRAATPNLTKHREIIRNNTAKYRERVKNALLTEEIRLQRKLSSVEAKDFLEEKKRLWKMRYEAYRNEHPELKHQEALARFAEMLNEEVRQRYERALASGPIKKATNQPQPRKLRELQNKFNR